MVINKIDADSFDQVAGAYCSSNGGMTTSVDKLTYHGDIVIVVIIFSGSIIVCEESPRCKL